MSWLKDGITRLINARNSHDIKEFGSAYDDCLWRITTSGKDQLEEYVTHAWETPYDQIPIPLMVTMCRLYVLESQKRTPEVEYAINFIVSHCSDAEEQGATGSFSFAQD